MAEQWLFEGSIMQRVGRLPLPGSGSTSKVTALGGAAETSIVPASSRWDCRRPSVVSFAKEVGAGRPGETHEPAIKQKERIAYPGGAYGYQEADPSGPESSAHRPSHEQACQAKRKEPHRSSFPAYCSAGLPDHMASGSTLSTTSERRGPGPFGGSLGSASSLSSDGLVLKDFSVDDEGDILQEELGREYYSSSSDGGSSVSDDMHAQAPVASIQPSVGFVLQDTLRKHPLPPPPPDIEGRRPVPKAGARLARLAPQAAAPRRKVHSHLGLRAKDPRLPRKQPTAQRPKTGETLERDKMRNLLRKTIIDAAGSAEKAVRTLDVNGSGRVSLSEMTDGLKRLHIQYQNIGIKHDTDLFLLFDKDHSSFIDADELFPSIKKKRSKERHLDTPELWNDWCAQQPEPTKMGRGPMWRHRDLDELIERQTQLNWVQEEMASRRKWISTHYRLLRDVGKSTTRCREWIAHHLPGTAPQARTDVEDFVKLDPRTSRQTYLEEVNTPARNIQGIVRDMREQRRVLSTSRRNLWSLIEEPAERQRDELAKQQNAALVFAGLGTSATQKRMSVRMREARAEPLGSDSSDDNDE